MPKDGRPLLADTIAALAARWRPLRVWSLIVTVFGDAVAPRGGELAVSSLTEIMEGFGIAGGAVRTALSRLDQDGLIERRRTGRNSFARLTPSAMAEFAAASERIYAAQGPAWPGRWTVAVLPAEPGEAAAARRTLEQAGFRTLGGMAMIAPTLPGVHADETPGVMLLDGTVEPGSTFELARRIYPIHAATAEFQRLIADFTPVADALERAANAPFDLLLARLALIHDYRRIVLRFPPMPDALTPDDWPGKAARALAAGIYAGVREGSEAFLDTHAVNARGFLPPPDARFQRRFASD